MTARPTPATEPRTLSPWMIIGGIVIVAFIAVLGLAILMAMMTPEPSPVPRGIAQATLTDGSVLVLHDVVDGTNDIILPVPMPPTWKARLGLLRPETHTFRASREGGNPFMLWLARYDADTGRPLPFDTWSHCRVRTADGHELYDSAYATRVTLETVPHHSESSTSSSRPFSPVDPGDYSHIVYASSLPRFRSSGSPVEIAVYDADAGLTATMTVPGLVGVVSTSTWTPDPLPDTGSDGDVEVTLTSLTSAWHVDESKPVSRPRQQVTPEFEVRQNGEVSTLWSDRRITLCDELGNESSPFDCSLSPRETAWQVQLQLFRSDQALLKDNNWLVVEDLELPDANPATEPNMIPLWQFPDEPLLDESVTVIIGGVGGPGVAEYDFTSWVPSRQTHYAGDGIVIEYEPPDAHLKVDRAGWHVVLHAAAETPDHKVTLFITDQNGVLIPAQEHRLNTTRVYTFQPDEWVSAVNLYATVQRARNVAFTVAPPQPPPTP